MRVFVALELPETVREELRALTRELRRSRTPLRFADPSAIHLTLRFLGEVEPERFERLARGIRDGVDGPGPVTLTASGLGTFPSPGRARVLWAGLAGDVAGLLAVEAALSKRLAALGFPPEPRPFRPHLTLGRVRGRGAADLRPLLAAHGGFRGSPFTAGEAVLFTSILGPGGAEHTPHERIALRLPAQGATDGTTHDE